LGWNLHGTHAQEGDLVQLVGLRHKSFTFLLRTGADFQSHRGVIRHDEIIGRPWGSAVTSHNGSPFFMLQPALADLLRHIKRNTQILYPKDIGFILTTMGIGPGQHVIEAGTGSGALTAALAYAVGPQGRVTSYEAREPFQQLAQSNLQTLGLEERVDFKVGDIFDGFAESGVDALFLDVPNPYDYMTQVRAALKPGGFFGSILPTTNQVSLLLKALREHDFAFMDVCEVLLRYYRADPERLRPTDRMVAHTGFLIFARPVLLPEGTEGQALLAENAEAEPVEELGGR
jgi:tRNA (adenine57-N1/adenine58-N1)-methyltransferase catalytic subunit